MGTEEREEDVELMDELLREQGFQFDFLLQIWIFIVFLSGISAVLSAFIGQYVLAIINACVFFGAFLCFFAGAFRYYVLVIVLLLYSAVAFVLETYYAVALATDFYICDSDSCRGYKLILYDVNYLCVVLICVTMFVTTKQSWIILEDHRRIVAVKVESDLRRIGRDPDANKEKEY